MKERPASWKPHRNAVHGPFDGKRYSELRLHERRAWAATKQQRCRACKCWCCQVRGFALYSGETLRQPEFKAQGCGFWPVWFWRIPGDVEGMVRMSVDEADNEWPVPNERIPLPYRRPEPMDRYPS